MRKLERSFYSRDTIDVAKDLLGNILVHNIDGNLISGKIVEVEAYKGIKDKAAHSYGGRRTKRTEVMYGMPGTCYIFMIYGMYNCFNIVTEKEEIPTAVLVRALEPLSSLDVISHNRFKKNYNQLSKYEIRNLTNGPGKLCSALSIDRSQNKEDLCKNNLYILDSGEKKFEIQVSKRIGVDYAEEAADYPWRFYIKNNMYVSKK
ncbi:MAG: DNA-3-methyladenine glycosylase [Clostridium sp.]|jgi:DNA-3-methyladenine glycosylase|uniref:DNA-3-methyladenine glycosylase n=1 Tax=Clostridium sp. TaxID=1506 RepID=UPI0025BF43FC|nr:DNA-3-methyladenine glycosylase [Clostridium sp.]MCH3965335.1 DNA-3-methyladenine glycosylase [Clostridium sp.]MCI1714556.1 DNA-3-methyladenine glycosylase [Clostridium sp.]MCI1798818.1 DNA-3-methyladenine glycosylase [Clostridium sp.]MCI1812451.1 DNA-3-methyladenine glycosylase [Clostridium sp.]MCI1869628.1 DNA-3-methyladenine glycosylase [Clostridium sp.]